jgi:hypothetical protein
MDLRVNLSEKMGRSRLIWRSRARCSGLTASCLWLDSMGAFLSHRWSKHVTMTEQQSRTSKVGRREGERDSKHILSRRNAHLNDGSVTFHHETHPGVAP